MAQDLESEAQHLGFGPYPGSILRFRLCVLGRILKKPCKHMEM